MTKQAKILIAEHEEKSRDSLQNLLRSVGFEVITAQNGREALAVVDRVLPQVAIIDPLLSGIDGFSVSQQVSKSHPETRIIISSGSHRGDRYRRDALSKYGAAVFLEKPYAERDLIAAVKSCLRQLGFKEAAASPEGELDATLRDESLAGLARSEFDDGDDMSLDETYRDASLDNVAVEFGGMTGEDMDETVRDEPKLFESFGKKEGLPDEVNELLDRQMGDFSLKQGKASPAAGAAGSKSGFLGKGGSKPKREESPAMTMQVRPEDLQREIERIKEKNKQQFPENKREERNAASRVKITQSEDDTSGILTSNDIFGALIDDIESGSVPDSPNEIAANGVIHASDNDAGVAAEQEAERERLKELKAARAKQKNQKGGKGKKAKNAAAEAPSTAESPSTPESPSKSEAKPEPKAEPVAEPSPAAGPEPVMAEDAKVPLPRETHRDSPFATQPISEEDRKKAISTKPVEDDLDLDDFPDYSKELFSNNATGGSGSNEYQLLSKIASGGMAEVWKAKLVGEKGFEKIVAIKKILPHLSDNEEFISMFIDEARVAANLTHPNIAQIYELGKMDDSFFIAMEYVAGHNLRMVLNQLNQLKVTMAPEVVVFVGMKLCNALQYAHVKKSHDNTALNIVHRDISPQNILISTEGEIKLVDFGIAKASIKATQTVAGSLKGKLLYMSPEQAEGKPLDGRSDIFSLGSVLYEALTGKKLFAGDSELSILKNVRQAKFTRLSDVNPHVPVRLEKIILKVLSKDLDSRYDRAKTLEKEFKTYLKEEKIHINESDVADYIRLIYDKDVERLKKFGRPDDEPGADEVPNKPKVILPDTGQIEAFEEEAVETKKGISPLVWVGLGLVAAAAVAAVILLT
ncbi:protein kinase domain-containing protein [Acanthopleuribacter pedis]|uniref:Protein kinase n=1 Tax=Acanthopleuribacter pedis TaxID=442870 RepID=A0A8J7U708_9BACT|nr:protein kinase [Acanthopleuribacter pedis]MBO1322499.1 protein kinase [Acanthopleuribacter pedis]